MPADPASRLETARELIDEGRPARAAALLSRHVPAPLAPERAFLLAEALRAQGFFLGAAALYRGLLARGPRRDPDLWLESALALAAVWRSLGRVASARRLLSAGRAAARGRAGVLERLSLEDALTDRAEGRYARSLSALKGHLALRRARGDRAGAAFILWATGGARRFAGDLAGSRRDFLASLSAASAARDLQGMAYALFGLGGVSRILGRLGDSRGYYLKAGALLRRTDDLFGRAYAECGLANALRQLGDTRGARAGYLRSHRLYSSLGDTLDLAYVDWGLGKVELMEGRPAAAVPRLRKALAAFAAGGEDRGEVLSCVALASALHAVGRTAEAERLFDRGLKLARRAGIHAHLETYT